MKGEQIDTYLSIEKTSGEIFGSINSSNFLFTNLYILKKIFLKISLRNKKNHSSATLIFDGNCPREFLDCVKKETTEDIFTKYYIPANFSKLIEFKNEPEYFKGFNLFINLKEANILLGSKFQKNSVDASKAIFKKIETATNVVVVTDGPNVACGINKEQIVKVKPNMIVGNVSRLGPAMLFLPTFFLTKLNLCITKELYHNKKTQEF